MVFSRGCLALVLMLTSSGEAYAQAPAASRLSPNLTSNIERPLRYRPDGADFVIENGTEFFNRPLYGSNTAFRVDGGDKPEFVLYLPGRGGNLRLGLRSAAGTKWLHEAASITTRYRPGELLYEIRDPLLGPTGVLRLAVLAWHQTEGLAVRAEGVGLASGLELIWAYGGVNGQRGVRDGDIGTEKVPISEWFQLQPEFCRDNRVELADGRFTLRAKAATLTGLVPVGSRLTVGDAVQWNDLPSLLSAVFIRAPDQPVVVGRAPLANGQPLLLSLQRLAVDTLVAEELDTYKTVTADRAGLNRGPVKLSLAPVFVAADLPQLFAATEAHFAALRGRVAVETPDPYLNAAVGALNVAADAVWDEPQQAIMHGAIAWRTKLLGWRGPYALDALGWHDRARANLTYWAGRQNTDPIPEKLPPPDATSNLARSEAALHSNGDLSNSHYDMNLVFIDGLFRHLLWTGDVEFAQKMWPVIERHLAWERRLFRREFGPEKLPLYEAYAAIWASDDLHYSGGGTAHASAYNYWHNKMAARLSPLVGTDPAPYMKEADLIARAMRELLWLDETGMFAESKDLLGRQLLHPSAALWSFYHAMDADLVTAKEASSMAAYVAMQLPWLPSPKLEGVESGYLIGTTNWMPYTWSLNNVVFGESMHGALGLWQANSPHAAWVAMRGSVITSMFAGICPGNVGSMTYHDVYRRESQRDFADGSGTFSRALVEGLFGVRPDALQGELLVRPGFPQVWRNASIEHPEFSLTFRKTKGPVSHYRIESRFGREMALRFQAQTWGGGGPRGVRVNGQKIEGRFLGGDTWARFEFTAPAAKVWAIEIEGEKTQTFRTLMLNSSSGADEPDLRGLPHVEPDILVGKAEIIDLTGHFNDRVTEIVRLGKYLSPRSPFVSLALPSQGIGYWAGHVNATAEIDDTGLRTVAAANGGKITLPSGMPFATPGPGDAKNILFVSQWDNYPREATVPLTGKASRLSLLMAGSTNAMQSRLDNGEVIVAYTDGTTTRLALRNPETWWPIEQDYFIDDYQFHIEAPLPTRVDLKTGAVRVLDHATFKGQGRVVPGGAATVLELALDPQKELHSLTVRALANDIVIGLMAATLAR